MIQHSDDVMAAGAPHLARAFGERDRAVDAQPEMYVVHLLPHRGWHAGGQKQQLSAVVFVVRRRCSQSKTAAKTFDRRSNGVLDKPIAAVVRHSQLLCDDVLDERRYELQLERLARLCL